MKIDALEAAKILKNEDNISILTHFHPDGDTLGSAFALLRVLRCLGKKVNVINNDDIHKKYAYLWNGIEREDFEEKFIVSVDVATEDLLGDDLQEKYGGKIDLAIDHHPSNTFFAKKTCLEGGSAATAEIINVIISELGVEIDSDTASCIYTGVSTDTGCFKFRNTTARTLYTAAKMKELGADTENINEVMFETKSRGELELEKIIIESMGYYCGDKLAIAIITRDMYKQTGTSEDECEYISAIPRQIAGVMVGVTIKERSNGNYKASVRTKSPISASEICKRFGGGGHENAAGCRFDGTIDEFKNKLIEATQEELK